ncbi:hypothetical protein EJB05_06754, partial [Eragrostis curvula]
SCSPARSRERGKTKRKKEGKKKKLSRKTNSSSHTTHLHRPPSPLRLAPSPSPRRNPRRSARRSWVHPIPARKLPAASIAAAAASSDPREACSRIRRATRARPQHAQLGIGSARSGGFPAGWSNL